MDEHEYLCEAIRLADDWYITHIFAGEDIVAYNPNGGQYPEASFVLQNPTQSGKDALAAQLVRQTYGHCVRPIALAGPIIYDLNDPMNTIKIIVDSEVLL